MSRDGQEGFVVFDSERGVVEIQSNETDAAHAATRLAKKDGERSIGLDTRNSPVQSRVRLSNPVPSTSLAQTITKVLEHSESEVMGRDEKASLRNAYEVLKTYFPIKKGRLGNDPYDAGSFQPLHIIRAKGLLKQNTKLEKGEGRGEVPSVAFGLSLVPAMFGHAMKDSNGVSLLPQRPSWRAVNAFATGLKPDHFWNLCPQSTKECQRSCLVTGHNGELANFSKLLMTFALQNHPAEFLRLLVYALDGYFLEPPPKIAKKRRFVRLNVYSDVLWERVAPWLFKRYAKTGRFYDYSKLEQRFRATLPSNYDLTFSYSGGNLETCEEFLKTKRARCAIVFLRSKDEWKGLFKKRSSYRGFPVVDGDRHDFRPYDPKGVWVALRWKTPTNLLTAEEKRSGMKQGFEAIKKFVVRARLEGGEWVLAEQPAATSPLEETPA